MKAAEKTVPELKGKQSFLTLRPLMTLARGVWWEEEIRIKVKSKI